MPTTSDASYAETVVPYQALLEALPAAAYLCAPDGRIRCFNSRCVELWGRAPLLGDSTDRYCGSYALASPAGAPIAHEHCWMALALRDGQPYEGREIVVVRPDGTRRTALAHASPLRDGEGRLVGGVNVLVDCTQQKAALAALESSEANFRGFFESAAVGAVQVGIDGRFLRVNDRYCEITGYSRHELLSMSPFDLDHPDDREADMQRVSRFIENHASVYHVEKRYVRKDGRIAWVHVAANLLRDDAGQPLHTVAIVADITERKAAEQALQEADRRKDEFIATLSHELRNPLAPLQSAVDLMRHGDQQHDAWCRDVIERQVRHLTRLIDDLLDVSRMASDKLELRRERIDVEDVLSAAIEAASPLLERCNQVLLVRGPDERLYVDGDLVRLTQVFTNLLTNAAKFTNGPGTVRLNVTRAEGHVTVCIEDGGIGMSREELDRVFDRFYQAPHARTRYCGGLGVGLSLVRKLVELHGGSVHADSAGPGLGSQITVRLPVAEKGEGAAAEDEEVEEEDRG